MAEAAELQDDDLDLRGDGPAKAAAPKKRGMMKVIGLVAGGVVVVGASVGATLYLLRSGAVTEGYDIQSAVVDPAAEIAGGAKSKTSEKGPGGGASSAAKKSGPALYLPLDPPFTVNFESDGRVHFLQISMEVMARDPAVIEEVEKHLPLIRNNVLLLLSDLSYSDINSRAAKEKIRADSLDVVRKSLRQETANAAIEDVYFTSFVMQ